MARCGSSSLLLIVSPFSRSCASAILFSLRAEGAILKWTSRLDGIRPGRLTQMALAILLFRSIFTRQAPVRYHDKCQQDDQKDEAEKKLKEEALDMK